MQKIQKTNTQIQNKLQLLLFQLCHAQQKLFCAPGSAALAMEVWISQSISWGENGICLGEIWGGGRLGGQGGGGRGVDLSFGAP